MKSRSKGVWTALSLCLVFSSLAQAGHSYYVSTSGNNANSGLGTSNAWATLQFAADRTAAGDTVLVMAGTYAGVRMENSGTPAAPITLRSSPGATVVLNAPSPNNKRKGVIEVETWGGSGVVSNVVVENNVIHENGVGGAARVRV